MEFLLLLFPVAFMMLGAIIGKERNHAILGAILGLALGPIGLIIIFIFSRQDTSCPHCGAPNVTGSRTCKVCNKSPDEPTSMLFRSGANELSLGQKACPCCRQQVEASNPRCACGYVWPGK
jgi:hypothetical protein